MIVDNARLYVSFERSEIEHRDFVVISFILKGLDMELIINTKEKTIVINDEIAVDDFIKQIKDWNLEGYKITRDVPIFDKQRFDKLLNPDPIDNIQPYIMKWPIVDTEFYRCDSK